MIKLYQAQLTWETLAYQLHGELSYTAPFLADIFNGAQNNINDGWAGIAATVVQPLARLHWIFHARNPGKRSPYWAHLSGRGTTRACLQPISYVAPATAHLDQDHALVGSAPFAWFS